MFKRWFKGVTGGRNSDVRDGTYSSCLNSFYRRWACNLESRKDLYTNLGSFRKDNCRLQPFGHGLLHALGTFFHVKEWRRCLVE